MKKFLTAAIIGLIICLGVKVEASEFNQEQFQKLIVITVENPAFKQEKNLPFDAVTFQKNFNELMTKFIKGTDANKDDAATLEQLFLIGDPPKTDGKPGLFGKNFFGKNAIIGLIDEKGNLKVMNFFFAPEDENDSKVSTLLLDAFVKSIVFESESENLFEELNNNQNKPAIRNGAKFSIVYSYGEEKLNIMTVVAE